MLRHWFYNRLCWYPSCTALAIHGVVNNLISNDWHFGLCGSICIKAASIPVTTPPSLCVLMFDWLRDWEPEWHLLLYPNVFGRKGYSSSLAPVVFLYNTKKGLNKTELHLNFSGVIYCTIRFKALFTPSPLVDWSDKETLIDVAQTLTDLQSNTAYPQRSFQPD